LVQQILTQNICKQSVEVPNLHAGDSRILLFKLSDPKENIGYTILFRIELVVIILGDAENCTLVFEGGWVVVQVQSMFVEICIQDMEQYAIEQVQLSFDDVLVEHLIAGWVHDE